MGVLSRPRGGGRRASAAAGHRARVLLVDHRSLEARGIAAALSELGIAAPALPNPTRVRLACERDERLDALVLSTAMPGWQDCVALAAARRPGLRFVLIDAGGSARREGPGTLEREELPPLRVPASLPASETARAIADWLLRPAPARPITAPALRRARGGWVATGPQFTIWQEDEPSARTWLHALTGRGHVGTGAGDAPARAS